MSAETKPTGTTPAAVAEKMGVTNLELTAARVCPSSAKEAKACGKHAEEQRARIALVAFAILTALTCYTLNYLYFRPLLFSTNPTPDFACYYRPAKMIVSGDGAKIYDLHAQHEYDARLQAEVVATGQRFDSRHFIAVPFILLAFIPLTYLSYPHAELTWYVLNVCMLLGLPFVLRHILGRGKLLAIAIALPAFFFPVRFTMIEGQSSILLLLLLALVLSELTQGHQVRAGCFLALAAFKPHLIVPLLLAFLVARQWKSVVGFCGTGLILLAASVALVGWRTTFSFPNVVLQFNRLPVNLGGDAPGIMPNIRGALYILFHSQMSASHLSALTASISALLIIAAITCFARFKHQALVLSFSMLMAISVLASYHGYLHEMSLMILPFLVVLRHITQHGFSPIRGALAASICAVLIIPLAIPSFEREIVASVAAILLFAATSFIEILDESRRKGDWGQRHASSFAWRAPTSDAAASRSGMA